MAKESASAGATRFIGPAERKPAPEKSLKAVPPIESDQTDEAPAPVSEPEPTPEKRRKPRVEHAIPTMGFPGTFYRLSKWVEKDPQVIFKKSKKEIANDELLERLRLEDLAEQERLEREAIAEQTRIRVWDETVTYLKLLSELVPQLTVVFVNTKGSGAKTTTWGYTSCLMSDILRAPLTAADFNFASGNGASRLEKDFDETMTLNEFNKLVEDNKELSFRQLNPRLRRNRFGVAVLSANDNTLEGNDVYGNSAEVMLNNLSNLTDYLMIDSGNDIQTTVMKRVLSKADVIVFTTNVDEQDSLLQLGTSMQIVRKLENARKVANSIVAISNLPAGHEAETYLRYTDRLNNHGDIKERYNFTGAFTAIPHDPKIKKSGLIDPYVIDHKTQQAYLDLAVLILEQGALSLGLEIPRGTA